MSVSFIVEYIFEVGVVRKAEAVVGELEKSLGKFAFRQLPVVLSSVAVGQMLLIC